MSMERGDPSRVLPKSFDVTQLLNQCCAPRPTLVLSSSGVILAANESSEKLLAPGDADTIQGRSIFQFDIVLIPDTKPVFRSLEALLQAIATRDASLSGSDARLQSSQSLEATGIRIHDDDADLDDTARFWNEHDGSNFSREVDAFISRKVASIDPAQSHKRRLTTSRVRVRIALRAQSIQGQLVFVMACKRPSLSENASHVSSPPKTDFDQRLSLATATSPLASFAPKTPENRDDLEDQIIKRLVPRATGLLDKDGQAVHLSPSWYGLTGLSEEQSLGSAWAQAIHPADVAGMVQSYALAIANHEDHWTYEARFRMVDRSYRWFLARIQAVNDDTGDIVKWHSSMMDVDESVSERLQSERRSQAILKLLSEADVSLWGFNQGHELFLREGTLDWTPLSNNPAHDIVTSPTGANGDHEVGALIQNILDGHSSLATREHQVQGRWYRTRFVPDYRPDLKNLNGPPIIEAVLGLTIDMTDVKARAMLEVENERLIATERAAKESNKMKSQFLANMSHEIRTPISGIIGLVELLTESSLNEAQQELIGGIQLSAAFLLSLINNVLDFSKIESGHMELESTPFKPLDLVADIRLLMFSLAQKKGIDMVIENSVSELLTVVGDRGRLRQVLINLLSNSIKFTETGSVTLIVRLADVQPLQNRETSQRSTLELIVHDTGPGLSKETMKKLFKPFTQADSSTARMHGGSGLGLSISRQLIELMDGTVTMDSVLGQGTTVTVSVPFDLAQVQQEEGLAAQQPHAIVKESTAKSLLRDKSVLQQTLGNASSLHQKPAATSSILGTRESPVKHVLVVEDNLIMQKIAVSNLCRLGFSVSTAVNGQEALDYLDLSNLSNDAKVPSVILMDCQMPTMDGYEATRILRHDSKRFDEELRTIPIIAMTASAIKGDREKCEEAGMDDYLTKPVNKDTLERVLTKWMTRDGGSKSS